MYFQLKPIELSSKEAMENLLSRLLYQQISADTHQWKLFQKFHEDEEFLEQMDTYQLCNFRIVYELLGFKDIPNEMHLYFGHIMRYIIKKDQLSTLQQQYAELVMDYDIFLDDGFDEDSTFDVDTRIQNLLQTIKSFL